MREDAGPLTWSIEGPGATAGSIAHRSVSARWDGAHWSERLLPSERPLRTYALLQADAAAAVDVGRFRFGRPQRQRAMALFVGSGIALLTTRRLLLLLNEAESLHGPIERPEGRVLRAVLGLETIAQIRTRGIGNVFTRDAAWNTLVETIDDTVVSLDVIGVIGIDNRVGAIDQRTLLSELATASVARLRAHAPRGVDRRLLDEAEAGRFTAGADGQELVAVLHRIPRR